MQKDRLLAFSDGVFAIIITIMVLELKVPHAPELSALAPLYPQFMSYALSFLYVAIYWNNHHHLMHAVSRVSASILWGNTHLLFWLSLVPFATGWMGENHFAVIPTIVYAVALLLPGIAYQILMSLILRSEGCDSALARALGRDAKGKISVAIYAAAIPAAFINPWITFILCVLVAFLWLVPDRRIESFLMNRGSSNGAE